MPERKVCRRCGQSKPLQEFGLYRRAVDGHRTLCRRCQRDPARPRRHRFATSSAPAWVKSERRLALQLRSARWLVAWLFNRDGGLCHCGEPIDVNELFHIDHIVPLAHGGTSHPSNLRLVHPCCNPTRPRGGYPAVSLDQRPEWLRELDGMPELERLRAIVTRCLASGAKSAPKRRAA